MALLRRTADPGNGEGAQWAKMRVHLVRNKLMDKLGLFLQVKRRMGFPDHAARGRTQGRGGVLVGTRGEHRQALHSRYRPPGRRQCDLMGLLGILLALGLLVWLAYRGWSVLLLAPAAALDRRRGVPRAAARPLDANLHGQRGAVSRAILPAVPARRAVRQADGRQRFGRSHRALHDRAVGCAPRDPGGGAGGRIGDVWRRQPVRRLLCPGADGAGAVSGRRHSAAADAGGDRARHLDVHDDGVSRHAGDPERDSDAVFRHHAVCRARPRHHRLGHHAGIWIVVAGPFRSRRPAGRRGLWRHRSCVPQPLPTIRSFASARRPRANSIPRRSATAGTRYPGADRVCRAAAGRCRERQSPDVARHLAAPGFFLPGGGALGRHLAVGRRGCLVGRGGARGRDPCA